MITIATIWIWGIVLVARQLLLGARPAKPVWQVAANVMGWPFWLLINLVGIAAIFAMDGEDDAER